jgi:hypothetical protein
MFESIVTVRMEENNNPKVGEGSYPCLF